MVVQANSLKSWRERQGMTQKDLAAALGVHVQYVSEIERGRLPGMRVAMKIRDVTGGVVTLDDLAPRRDAA